MSERVKAKTIGVHMRAEMADEFERRPDHFSAYLRTFSTQN